MNLPLSSIPLLPMAKDAMDASLILVGWNSCQVLMPCLESIVNTVHGITYEIIYVDNHSHDGSVEAVRASFPHVRLIANEENRGFGVANNQGMALMQGRYAILLNSDTLLLANALEEMVRFLDAHPEVGCAGGMLLNRDGSRQHSIHNYPTLLTELTNKSLLTILWPGRYPSKRQNYTYPLAVEAVLGAYLAVRREVIETVGGFDSAYFLFLEETDWCYRIHRAGWKIYFVPASRLYHLQGKSVGRHKRAAKLEYFWSRYTFFRLHRSRFSCGVLRVGLFLRLCLTILTLVMANIFTLGLADRLREKLGLCLTLLLWHFQGCPAGAGRRLLEKKT